MEQWRLVALQVSFVNQCATWLRAECTHSFDLRVFITSCLCRFVIFFVEMADVKELRVYIKFCFKLDKSVANACLRIG
jgi:hypothetical protein